MANSIFITFAGANFAVPGQVAGDLFVAVNGTTITRLADAATGNVLLSGGVGAAPSYGKVGLTTHVSGVLPVANGGTNIASYAVGDLIYASGATTLAKLADVATGSVLVSGGIGVAPAWSTSLTLSGALSVVSATITGGTLSVVGDTQVGATNRYLFENRGIVGANADGVFRLTNWNGDDFGRLMFGGTTSAFPALKRSGAALHARVADDSAYAAFAALSYNVNGTAGAAGGTFTTITSITVVNGIVTAIAGS